MTSPRWPTLALLSVLLLAACSRVPVIQIDLAATVGTDPETCAASSTLEVDDRAVTTVYYCYTVTNVGRTTASVHGLSDALFGEILSDFAFELAPGASIDTVTAGIVLDAEIADPTSNEATWTASATGAVASSATAATQVTVVEPWRYAAVAGTMVAGGNDVAPFAGNVLYLGIRHRSGEPIATTTDVTITLPNGGTHTLTFDPAMAAGGTTIAVVADFAQAAAATRFLDVPVVALAAAGDLAPAAVLGGDFTIAFLGETLTRSVDADAALIVPAVTSATVNAGRASVSVAFDANAGVEHGIEVFGASANAFSGSTTTTASPVTVALNGALLPGEPFVVDVLAYRNRVGDAFAVQGQSDLAAYVHVGN